MKDKLIMISKFLSMLFIIFGFILLVPAGVALFSNAEKEIAHVFYYPALGSVSLGGFLFLLLRNRDTSLNLANSMVLSVFSWVFLSLVGSLPFLLAFEISFLDAFTEAVSGLTTTGVTTFEQPEHLPYAFILWRSLMQWVGGLGILSFFLFITSNNEIDMWHLFSAEGHKIASARPVPNVFRTITILWMIYGGLSTLLLAILLLLGLPLNEALIYTLTTVSTGGFSGHRASAAFFDVAGFQHAALIEYTLILFMFFGGLNFLIHYRLLKGDYRSLWRQIEARSYIRTIVGATLLILVSIALTGSLFQGDLHVTFRRTLFQVVSLITSTGFTVEGFNENLFPATAHLLFLILMFVGGSVGSTSGGVKIMRLVLLEKLFKREIKKITLPSRAVSPIVVDGSIVTDTELTKVAALIGGWLLFIAGGSLLLTLFSSTPPFEALTSMTSAMGNMGPMIPSGHAFTGLSIGSKWVYIVAMLAGRLELLPIAVLFTRRAWN